MDPKTDSSRELPEGHVYTCWEQDVQPRRTLVVAAEHPDASDENPGSEGKPYRTINAASRMAEPGDRVLVRAGIYRECVRPQRGGTGPDAMISYEAAEGERVVITGAEVLPGPWTRSQMWQVRDGKTDAPVWETRMPRDWFVGVNPFAMPNRAVTNLIGGFNQQASEHYAVCMLRCGLVFQDGRRLQQVNDYSQLQDSPGCYWPDPGGLILHIRPFDDVDPHDAMFEATARAQCIAPDEPHLGYIRIKGFEVRHAGNQFPFMPQEGAISANRGHHWIVEDCHVHQVNSVGIEVGKRDPRMTFPDPCGYQIVRRNVVRECGVCGLAGLAMKHGLVEDNLVEDCCWHDVEGMWESAGIKFHQNHYTLVRRNVVRRMKHGCGIWLDFNNQYMRCTRNVISNVTSLFGGIFVEASHFPSRVDHNIIVDAHPAPKGGGHGLYAHDNDYITVDHNLMLRCEGSAVHLPKGQADRFVEGRGSTSRGHVVTANLFVECARYVSFHDGQNTSDANVLAGQCQPGPFRMLGTDEWLDLEAWQRFHGLDRSTRQVELGASFDEASLTLHLSEAPSVPSGGSAVETPHDSFDSPRDATSDTAGPFARSNVRPDGVSVDPRRTADR